MESDSMIINHGLNSKNVEYGKHCKMEINKNIKANYGTTFQQNSHRDVGPSYTEKATTNQGLKKALSKD